MRFEKDVPITVLIKELLKEDNLRDSLAPLALLDKDCPEIVKEKAVAGAALYINPNSFCNEPHGFSNFCLVANGVSTVVNSVPFVEPKYIAYTLWELKENFNKDLVLHPEVVNYVSATLKTEDFIFPPDHLDFIAYEFIEDYGEDAEKVADFYSNYNKIPNFLNRLVKEDDFIKYHVLKLLNVDNYVLKMKSIFEKYRNK